MIDEDEDELEERFAEIKNRFVSGLPDRLAVVAGALPQVEGDGQAAAGAVACLYDAVHAMCGIAPMLGFAAIGDAARRIDNALVAAFRAKRGLAPGDADALRGLIETLRASCRAATVRDSAVTRLVITPS